MSQEGSVKPEICPATRAGTSEDAGGALLFMVSRAGAYCSKCFLYSLTACPITDSQQTVIFSCRMVGGMRSSLERFDDFRREENSHL